MNIKSNSYWLVVCVIVTLGLVAVMLGGCGTSGVSPQGGVISEIKMAAAVDENDRPLQPTSVFAGDAEMIYCSLKLSDFPPGTRIKMEWVYVGGEAENESGLFSMEAGIFRTDAGTIDGDGYTSIALELPVAFMPDYKWPKGDYKVVLSVEGEEKERASVSFKVE